MGHSGLRMTETAESMVLMIDNYDSFTYNVVQYLAELSAEVRVVRNDELTLQQLIALNPEKIVVSPGPCSPNEAGVSLQAIEYFGGRVPVLGICLGHQSIGQAYGGRIVHARQVMHGKTSPIHHSASGVFQGLATPFVATRYHSLVIDKSSLPDSLEVTAWTLDGDGEVDEIMGVRHRDFAIEGLQFHPESILSEYGDQLLRNFLQQ